MKHPHMSRLLLLPLVLVFGIVGCDDDTGTGPGDNTLGDFSTQEVTATLQGVLAPTNASAHASLVMGSIALQLDFVDPAWDGQVPEDLLGATLIYDPSTQNWVEDEGRAGAPEDGMRVIWYTMDEFGFPSIPMMERGHIDIRPVALEGSHGLALEYVQASDDRVLASAIKGIRVREEAGVRVREVSLDGTFYGDTGASDISLVTVDSLTEADNSQYYSYDLAVEGGTGSYQWSVSGTGDTETGAFEESLDIGVTSAGVETVLDMDTEGQGESSLDGVGTLFHGTGKVADVEIRDAQFRFTGADGDGFTAQATYELESLTYTMMVEGAFVTLRLLPLITQL